LALGLALAGCQLVDKSYEPRTYEVNLGSQNLREELILLNIVRASRFEPLNFTALSKYTATGSLSLSGSVTNNVGVDFASNNSSGFPGTTVGTTPKTALGASGSAVTGNAFDLVPLDNADFYAGFLAPLTPEKVYLLVNAGLSRDVVFHSILKAIEINLSDRGKQLTHFAALRYSNDPSDDTWNKVHHSFEQCAYEMELDQKAGRKFDPRVGKTHWAPFQTPFWYGSHLNDCSYHKFLELLKAALEYGVTTYATPRKEKTPQVYTVKDPSKGEQINIAVSSTTNSGAEPVEKKEIRVCFDATIAAEYGNPIAEGCDKASGKPIGRGAIVTQLGAYDDSMVPVLQSPYGVFQYYGALLRSHIDVKIEQKKTDDATLLNITSDLANCFAHVNYSGESFCVPDQQASNTKEVLTVLIALVNLSTSRSSLPVTPSVLVNSTQ
jgi:hypothetical protein